MATRRVWILLTAAVAGSLLRKPGPASAGETQPASSESKDSKIIAYYFHVTVRCDTCRRIERYSEEAIREHFAKELAEGKIEWRPVNVQLEENRHYIKKYKLFTRTLLFAMVEGGTETRHKNLERIWQLVGMEKFFKQYVRSEMEKYLRRLE